MVNKNTEDPSEAYKKEKYEKCLKLSNNILENEEYNFNALCYKGSCLLKLKYYEEAVETLTLCMSIRDDVSFLWVLRGDAFNKLGDYKKAFSDYWFALSLDESNGAVLDKSARVLFLLGEQKYAFELLKKTIEIAESPEPYLVMIHMLKKKECNSYAKEIYQVGVKKFPKEKKRFDKFLKNEH